MKILKLIKRYELWIYTLIFTTISIGTTNAQNDKTDTNLYAIIDRMPVFGNCKGKDKAELKSCSDTNFMNYLSKAFVYPKYAIENNLDGIVYLKYEVNKKGEVVNVEIIQGIENCEPCNNEALKIIQSSPKWKPGKHNGKKVRIGYHIPITFKIEN